MSWIETACRQLKEPTDYFREAVGSEELPIPLRPLLFARQSKQALQQEALENRSHHRFVLIFNLKTTGHVHADNLSLPFHPGEALLIHPYQFHHFSHLEKPELLWLVCTFELKPKDWLASLRNRPVHISTETQQARDALLRMWQNEAAKTDGRLQLALLQLLLSLKRDRLTGATDLPPEPKENLMRTVNRMLSEQRGTPATSADLARALDMSESRLRVLFKETAGVPLGSYISNYRLTRAMGLLRNSSLSIADVAEEAGFGSPQAFSRVFKNETGQTPREYRNQL